MNNQLEKAIETKDLNEWRLFRIIRNAVSRLIEKSKRLYYTNKMMNNKGMWQSLQDLMYKNWIQTPRRLNYQGQTITSPKEIAQKMCKFFIKKVMKIREKFTKPSMDPIRLLRILIPRPKSEFHMEEITIEETRKIIMAMKNTNTVGFDRISAKILKLSVEISSILITHAINVSIREGILPSAVKIARVVPILKPTKIKSDPEGYRLINNLHTIEKVMKSILKDN